MQTGGIREVDAKGRHTTTHRELFELDGVSLIDTPGLRELGMIDAFPTARTAANRAARFAKPWRTERFQRKDGRRSAGWRMKTNGARSERTRR